MRKLDHYIQDAEVTVRSDHLPLKTFLHKNTLNTKVNNWAIDITSRCRKIQFEYIKEIKNTLADTMSRLIKITPEIAHFLESVIKFVRSNNFSSDVFDFCESRNHYHYYYSIVHEDGFDFFKSRNHYHYYYSILREDFPVF